jgi:hypothetical protein
MSDPDELARVPCYQCKGYKVIDHGPCGGTGKITKPCPLHNNISFCMVCGDTGFVEFTCQGCNHGKVRCDVCGDRA